MKITVRFIVEQDFEVDVKDEKLGLGSGFAVGDAMVSSGYDVWDVTTQKHIFENPISDIRPVQDRHFFDCNMYTVPEVHPWLLEGDEDPNPYEEYENDE